MAGANSIFYGDKLLTTGNPDVEADQALFRDAGLKPIEARVEACEHHHQAEGDPAPRAGAAE
jgi:biotin synthase